MAESYSVKATLSAVDRGFSSTLKSAYGSVESLGSKIKSGLSFGVFAGIGQKAFSAVTDGARELIGELNSSNAAWKTFTGNMQIMGKGEKEINSVKSELQSFAEQTIYSASDMAQTYAQLAAVGTKNTTALVKGFGGLASASENPQQAMKTLSQQATQMAARPSVAWQDFKLMLEQSPAGMAAVAKQMGMTTAELVQKIQDGEVATNDFFKAIEEVGTSKSFTEMATQYKTAGQAASGLMETLSNKLGPSFEVLNKLSIKALSGITDKISAIKPEELAAKVEGVIDTINEFINVAKKSFSGVGTAVKGALKTIGEALGLTNAQFSKTDALNAFKNACDKVAGAIKSVCAWITANKDTLSKVLPVVLKVAGAFAALKVAEKVVPGFSLLTNGLKALGGKALSGITSKLFKTKSAATEAGTASAASGKQMLQAAGSYALMGVAVLLIAAGFALLAQSAIALSNAGGDAIAIMAVMTLALVGLGIGMAALMKSLAPMSGQLIAVGVSFALMGAAVLLIAAGFMLMAQASIALASAGWGAIAVMVGMVAVIALLAAGAAILGTALTAGAVGFIAFGAALLLCGIGAILAATSLVILSTCLPVICTYGVQGALAILALGAALLVFGAGALVAGAGALVLGAGLLVVAAAVTVLAAGVLVLSVAALIAAAALSVVSLVLPAIVAHGTAGAVAIAALGAGLIAFAVGAGIAGAAAIVLGTGMLLASVGILLCAAGIAIIAASIAIIGSMALIAAASFMLMATVLPLVTANALGNAAALAILAGGLITFGAGATVAGAGALVLGAGLAVVGAGLIVIGAALIVMALGGAAAAGAMALLNLVMPQFIANSTAGSMALMAMGGALVVFGAGALVAGAGALVLGAGLALIAVSVLTLALGFTVMYAALALATAGLTLLISCGTQGAATLTVLSGALVMFAGAAALAGAACLLLAAGLLAVSVAMVAGAVVVVAFGVALLAASVGALAMLAAVAGLAASMAKIAKDAKTAAKSLKNMQKAVDVVESGLKGIGNMAESAMNSLINAFKGAQGNVVASAQQMAVGFVTGLQSGLMLAPAVALATVVMVASALQSGYAQAYAAGAYVSQGFAAGMRSCLGQIRLAAQQMAAAADQAARAKLKIHSPSKVAEESASYYGDGWINKFKDMRRKVWDAAENLITMPSLSNRDLSLAYAGEMSSDYEYYRNAQYTIVVPVEIDGKEVARSTAPYTEAELNMRQKREDRKNGRR